MVPSWPGALPHTRGEDDPFCLAANVCAPPLVFVPALGPDAPQGGALHLCRCSSALVELRRRHPLEISSCPGQPWIEACKSRYRWREERPLRRGTGTRVCCALHTTKLAQSWYIYSACLPRLHKFFFATWPPKKDEAPATA
eukprot:scaffold1439_cov404-Prasinococcus_capsulatus_cf.AAC.58